MARTPEQRQADDLMSEAVEAAAHAYGIVPEDATVTDFIIVVEGIKYDARDEETFVEYRGVVYRDASTRASVAVGLLRLGEKYVMDDATVPFDGG